MPICGEPSPYGLGDMLDRQPGPFVALCAGPSEEARTSTMSGTSNRGTLNRWEASLYFLVPAAIAIATGRGVIGRVLSGGLVNPDSYMRLVRIEEMLRQHRTLDVVAND